MHFPQGEPFIELFLRDAISLAELLYGKSGRKVLPEQTKDAEKTVSGIRNDYVGKDGVGMLAAVTENAHHTKVGLFPFTCMEVDNGATIVVVDVTVTGASTEGTGLKARLKISHVGIKKRF